MKKLTKQIVMIVLVVMMSMTLKVNLLAAENSAITILKMVTTTEDVDTTVEPKDGAEVFKSFPKGQDLLVVEIIGNEWYRIAYQNEFGYVKQSVTVENALFGENQTELDEQIQEVSDETTILVEVLEEEQTDTRRTLVWGLIIGILVVAIMAVGVWGKIKEDQKNMEKNKEGEDEKVKAESDGEIC